MAITAKPYLRDISLRDDEDIDFDSFPFTIPAVREMGRLELHADVTFFVGENGAGKSTILEAIAVGMGLPSEGGTRDVYREQQEASSLTDYLRLSKSFRKPKSSYFLRAESLFNVATYFDNVGSLRPSLHIRSHGEAFMDVMLGSSTAVASAKWPTRTPNTTRSHAIF